MPDLLDRPITTTPTMSSTWPGAEPVEGTPVLRPRTHSATFDLLAELFASTVRLYDTGAAQHPGTLALAELQEWLDMPLDPLARWAGLAASTRAFWRKNPQAPVRPGKTGRLLRLRTTVGLLVGVLGVEQARATLTEEGWLASPMDEERLIALESRVARALGGEQVSAPGWLGRLTNEDLEQRALGGLADELRQQALERTEMRSASAGSDAAWQE